MQRNYCSGFGVATKVVEVLKRYPYYKLERDFVAYRIGRHAHEIEDVLERLEKTGMIRLENNLVWITPEDLSKNLNPAAA